MKIKINNDYKCFMSIPNINFWYDYEGRKLFIGWLWWGIDLIFKGYEKQGKETSWKPSKEEMDVLYGLAYITNQYDEHKEEVITRLYQDLKREFFNGSSYENMFPNTEDGVRRRSTIQVLEPAWSEEDSDLMYDTLYNLTELKDLYGKDYGKVGKCIDWLRSLKGRVQPQWEPSDEQIKAIRLARSFVVDDFGEHPALSEILMELEKQLQKIKENKL